MSERDIVDRLIAQAEMTRLDPHDMTASPELLEDAVTEIVRLRGELRIARLIRRPPS